MTEYQDNEAMAAAFGLDEPNLTQKYGADTLAYLGIGGAALIEQSKTKTWANENDKNKVLEASENNVIIWDFDGVIADTEPTQWESFRTLLGKRGFVPESGFHKTLMGHTEPQIWELLFKMGAPVGNIDDLIAERSEIYVELGKQVLNLSWVAAELMPIFHETAKKQYVISNGNFVNNTALINHWEYNHYVEIVNTRHTTKADLFINHARTEPTVVFEDSERYACIAKDNGAFVVGVHHGLSLTPKLTADVQVYI